jgi:hypothetical protein
MKLDKKALFHLVLGFLPGPLGAAISAVETAITKKGQSKKSKAIEIATASLLSLNALSETGVVNDPRFKAAVGKANDALVEVANVAQKIHDEVSGASGADGTGQP